MTKMKYFVPAMSLAALLSNYCGASTPAAPSQVTTQSTTSPGTSSPVETPPAEPPPIKHSLNCILDAKYVDAGSYTIDNSLASSKISGVRSIKATVGSWYIHQEASTPELRRDITYEADASDRGKGNLTTFLNGAPMKAFDKLYYKSHDNSVEIIASITSVKDREMTHPLVGGGIAKMDAKLEGKLYSTKSSTFMRHVYSSTLPPCRE